MIKFRDTAFLAFLEGSTYIKKYVGVTVGNSAAAILWRFFLPLVTPATSAPFSDLLPSPPAPPL
jgi:hypothetical protein